MIIPKPKPYHNIIIKYRHYMSDILINYEDMLIMSEEDYYTEYVRSSDDVVLCRHFSDDSWIKYYTGLVVGGECNVEFGYGTININDL